MFCLLLLKSSSTKDERRKKEGADNGKGLAEEDVKSLFNRYYRGTSTGSKPEGSGLGLAIAKHIVGLHGGEITAQSALGEGTTIRVSLPISPEKN